MTGYIGLSKFRPTKFDMINQSMDEETPFGYQEGGGYHGDVAGGGSVVTETPEEMVRLAAIGNKRVRQTREWGSKRAVTEEEKSEWQSLADQIWGRNPRLSKSEVARIICKETGTRTSERTVRRYIVKR